MMDLKKFDYRKLMKSKLRVIVACLFGTLLLAAFAKYFISGELKEKEVLEKSVASKEIDLTSTVDLVSTDDLWRAQMQDNVKKQGDIINEKINEIKSDLSSLGKENAQLPDMKVLEEKIGILGRQIQDVTQMTSQQNLQIVDGKVAENENKISQYILNLEPKKESKLQSKTIENYIPAGSMAKAVLLSGVAAATSLNSASNPEPILIRILDHGTLPRRFQSDLKDCNIIGAVSGNISSERVKIRLEKLTCVDIKTKEIVETEVAGFVTGEDGLEGVKGEVISREGALLTNSLISGTLGGLANNFNSNTGNKPLEIVTNQSKSPSIGSRLTDSFTNGGESALDTLAKYYISRAESIQPVIEVGAGRKVDVIFTAGTFFGANDTKKTIEKNRSNGSERYEGRDNLIQPLN